MEANELMVGDIIYTPSEMECCVVKYIYDDMTCVDYKDGSDEELTSYEMFPVELDSEWLFKIDGVKESESGDYYLIVLKGSADMPLLCRTRNGWSVSIGMKLRDFEFQYVHQLQNIVKIITGCDLKIEL